jgi:DUF2075 family protein
MDEAPSTPSFRIERLPFDRDAVSSWGDADPKHRNWPIVYTIHGSSDIYIGETTSALKRMKQHLDDPMKSRLTHLRIVFDETFNKSACLDLESKLIGLFDADERFSVTNRNHGISDADYFNRAEYQHRFDEVFNSLLDEGMITRSIPDIVNSDLFKYSPFKALNTEQAGAIEGIVEAIIAQMESTQSYPIVVQGDPGTGKTIVAIYLTKLLADIAKADLDDELDSDSLFSDLFQSEYQSLFAGMKVGFVVPQKSLRKTISKRFAKTPGLSKDMVLSPFDVGASEGQFDLLIVDEAHRLGQRSNQSAGPLNAKFSAINNELFGSDDLSLTQLDWIVKKSSHQLLLIDTAQSVKPGDLPLDRTTAIINAADAHETLFRLASQMRVNGGEDYIDHVGRILNGTVSERKSFGNYDLRLFDDVEEMRQEIFQRDDEFGLSRLVAGYSWKWVSRENGNSHVPDIIIDDVEMFWNRTQTDWINSPTSIDEVGSIHTVQGYDLNYAGVIIGNDLRFDPATQKIRFSRDDYFDKKGLENNRMLGITYSDEEILEFVKNIYRVLMTRGIKGTYVYICDPELREYFRQYLP